MREEIFEKEEIAQALRELVAAIYDDCKGAYGSGEYPYQNEYEAQIQECAGAITRALENYGRQRS